MAAAAAVSAAVLGWSRLSSSSLKRRVGVVRAAAGGKGGFGAGPKQKQACPLGLAPYDQCCGQFHAGKALPPDAKTLMQSRYCAYERGLAQYIVDTTHPEHPDLAEGNNKLKDDVKLTIDLVKFTGFEIKNYEYEPESTEAFVTFDATFTTGKGKRKVQGKSSERSRFVKEGDRWLFRDSTEKDTKYTALPATKNKSADNVAPYERAF
eukprot:jgi/Chlat1/4429/Chrsp29S04390